MNDAFLQFAPLAIRLAFTMILLAVPAIAQQMHVSSPMRHHSDSFSESIGCNWGLSGKNWSINVGGNQGSMTPQFGNFDANGAMRGGFQFQKGGTSGYFNGWAGQSFSRSNVMESPSVTFMNGQGAYFQDVTETPFVVGVIPVVGSSCFTSPTPMPHDPTTTLSPSVLDQRIEQLNRQKAKPRVIREHPNAPALKQVEDVPQRTPKKTASNRSKAERDGTETHVSRSQNSHTADSPALSVAEMKRRNRAKNKEK